MDLLAEEEEEEEEEDAKEKKDETRMHQWRLVDRNFTVMKILTNIILLYSIFTTFKKLYIINNFTLLKKLITSTY